MNGAALLEIAGGGGAGPMTNFAPRLAVGGGGVDPTFGSGGLGTGTDGWFTRLSNGFVLYTFSAIWGTGGTAGSGGDGTYYIELPTKMQPLVPGTLGDRGIGQVFLVRLGQPPTFAEMFCAAGTPVTTGVRNLNGLAPSTTDWAKFSVGTTAFGGSASFAAAATVNVTHGLGAIPLAIQVTEKTANVALAVTAVNATSFTVTAPAATSDSFYWTAQLGPGSAGPAFPIAWASLADHLEGFIVYPGQ